MLTFHDPATGQVMALYTHGTDSSVWAILGYQPYWHDKEIHVKQLNHWARNSRLVFNPQGICEAVIPNENPVQPAPKAEV